MLFIPPSRYIFKGAEVYSDESESEDNGDSDNDDDGEENEENTNEATGESSNREVEEAIHNTSSDFPNAVDSSSAESRTSAEPHRTEALVQHEQENCSQVIQPSAESSHRAGGPGSPGTATSSVEAGNADSLGTEAGQEKADWVVTSTDDIS